MPHYIPNLSANLQLVLGGPSRWEGGASLWGLGSEGPAVNEGLRAFRGLAIPGDMQGGLSHGGGRLPLLAAEDTAGLVHPASACTWAKPAVLCENLHQPDTGLLYLK